jgi:hypothetical protein
MDVKTKITFKSHLKREIHAYLKDAGFQEYMYEIKTYKDRQYVEVFMSEKGIDFILNDVRKTRWKYRLEITKYKLDENFSAVFAHR